MRLLKSGVMGHDASPALILSVLLGAWGTVLFFLFFQFSYFYLFYFFLMQLIDLTHTAGLVPSLSANRRPSISCPDRDAFPVIWISLSWYWSIGYITVSHSFPHSISLSSFLFFSVPYQWLLGYLHPSCSSSPSNFIVSFSNPVSRVWTLFACTIDRDGVSEHLCRFLIVSIRPLSARFAIVCHTYLRILPYIYRMEQPSQVALHS